MLRAKTSDQIADITGERRPQRAAPAPAPAPTPPTVPAPSTVSPVIENAIAALSQHVQHAATMAAQASAEVAALAQRQAGAIEFDFTRDEQGRITRAIARRVPSNPKD